MNIFILCNSIYIHTHIYIYIYIYVNSYCNYKWIGRTLSSGDFKRFTDGFWKPMEITKGCFCAGWHLPEVGFVPDGTSPKSVLCRMASPRSWFCAGWHLPKITFVPGGTSHQMVLWRMVAPKLHKPMVLYHLGFNQRVLHWSRSHAQ